MWRHVAGPRVEFYEYPLTCIVARARVELYADPDCTTPRTDIYGVLLERGFTCGAVIQEVLATTRSGLTTGRSVAWALNRRVCPRSWCRDPTNGEIHQVEEGFEFAGWHLEHGEHPYRLRHPRRLVARARAR